VTLLINNAGISRRQPAGAEGLAAARAELETNFFGPWLLARVRAGCWQPTAAVRC
jgi:NAD(P)-dependent dehydrogenase (short-subunit alcohol dehydrogenase family)